MEITLEKIELVKDRTGVGYKEAKEALEKTDGNVVDAIILIEDSIDANSDDDKTKAQEIVGSIKEAVHKGNISKIIISKDGETILNLPVSIGLVGTVLFPWAVIVGTIAALGTKCSINLVKDTGEVVDLSTRAEGTIDTVVSKGGVIVDEVRDKSGEWVQTAKDAGGEFFNTAMDKGQEAFEKAREAGSGIFEAAVSKGSSYYESAKNVVKDKTSGVKAAADEAFNVDDFDLSDVDFSSVEYSEAASEEKDDKEE